MEKGWKADNEDRELTSALQTESFQVLSIEEEQVHIHKHELRIVVNALFRLSVDARWKDG